MVGTNAFLTVLPEMVAFLRVAELGSFSAAARQFGTTPSAVSRQVSRLEKHLGVQLLQRTTRQLRLTEAGDAAFVQCSALAAAAQEVMDVAQQLAGTPRGSLCVSAPKAFARHVLHPLLLRFLVQWPDVQLHLIDSFVDMQGAHLGKVDLVLRAGLMADTRLVATPLASMVRIACASPAYLKRRGTPTHPGELGDHDGLDWDGLAPPFAWRFTVDGQQQAHRPQRVRMSSNNAEALVDGALAGLGIAHLPTWLISQYLLRGELLPLFCDDGLPRPEASGIYALRLEQQANSRSRLLLEYLKSRFSPMPPWDLALQSDLRWRQNSGQ